MMLATYLDLPVILWEPTWTEGSRRLSLVQSKIRLDSGAGGIQDDVLHQPRPRTARSVTFHMHTRAEMAEARAFLRDVIRGRQASFWLSMELTNLELTAPVAADATTVTVDYIGYARFFAGAGYGREHLIFRIPNGGSAYRKVTAAVDNEDGTETLTIDSALGVVAPVSTAIAFLVLNRMREDLALLTWSTPSSGLMTLPLIDLPKETP